MPYVARFFPPQRRGFAMGFFGAGNAGVFVTPALLAAYGWCFVPRVYALALLATVVIFWFGSARDLGAGKTQGSWMDSFKVLCDPRVWRLCQTIGSLSAALRCSRSGSRNI
jgi:NNP family nitrate/nitrite transporter-like MFS transporter